MNTLLRDERSHDNSPKPESYAYAYPDLLTFHDAATPIETTLHEMHLEHRMRTF